MRVLFDAIEQSFEQSNIYGVIEDLYAGAGGDFLKCHECDYSSDRPNKFYDLPSSSSSESRLEESGIVTWTLNFLFIVKSFSSKSLMLK